MPTEVVTEMAAIAPSERPRAPSSLPAIGFRAEDDIVCLKVVTGVRRYAVAEEMESLPARSRCNRKRSRGGEAYAVLLYLGSVTKGGRELLLLLSNFILLRWHKLHHRMTFYRLTARTMPECRL